MKRLRIGLDLLLWGGIGIWGGWIFGFVPPAQIAAGGWAQKIFYLHVPSAMVGFVGFMLAALVSLGVLMGREDFWDRLLVSTVEVSYLFTCLVLVTGPLWARPVWGIWWRWEPRLTSFFVLWLTYSGWFLFRHALPEGSQRRFYSAIYAFLASLNIVVVIVSVYFWQPEMQLHPTDIQLDPVIERARLISMGVMLVVFARLLWLRTDVERRSRLREETTREEP